MRQEAKQKPGLAGTSYEFDFFCHLLAINWEAPWNTFH